MRHIDGFLGVYSSDNAVQVRKKGESLIINFDTEKEPGSHFVAIYMKNKNHCLYFDSLKIPIIPIELYKYLSSYTPAIIDCSKDVQSFNSTYCGFYCMLFILSNKISSDFWRLTISKFKTQSKSNDSKCIKYLCQSIKKYFTQRK